MWFVVYKPHYISSSYITNIQKSFPRKLICLRRLRSWICRWLKSSLKAAHEDSVPTPMPFLSAKDKKGQERSGKIEEIFLPSRTTQVFSKRGTFPGFGCRRCREYLGALRKSINRPTGRPDSRALRIHTFSPSTLTHGLASPLGETSGAIARRSSFPIGMKNHESWHCQIKIWAFRV